MTFTSSRSLFAAALVLVGCGPLPATDEDEQLGTVEQPLTSVISITGASLTGAYQHFDPGIFSIDANTNLISRYCIASGSTWLKPYLDTPAQCATRNNVVVPPDATFAYVPSVEDARSVSIKNLGVDNARWSLARADVNDPQVPATNPLKEVGSAFGLTSEAAGLRWYFNSAKLPVEIRYDIPGSGINVHVGERLSTANERKAFTPPSTGIEFATNLNLMIFTRSAPSGFSGITAAVNFVTVDVTGVKQPLQLIVSLFNPNGLQTEYIGNDGRNQFVSSTLLSTSRYITAVENTQKTAVWNAFQNFRFRVTTTNLQNMLADVNAKRASAGQVLLSTDPLKVTFKESTVRNESRFLYDANVVVKAELASMSISLLTP